MDVDQYLKKRFGDEYIIDKEVITIKPGKAVKSKGSEEKEIEPVDFLIQVALDGIVVDEEKASEGPCKCAPISESSAICWHPGIIGALNKDQQKKYCKEIEYENTKLPAHVEDFIKASKECEIGKEWEGGEIENLEDRLRCMHEKLSEKGVV